MNFDPSEEKPWGEAEWEKSMRESDVRSAKFGELLETLMDHPDRDAIISREMGWDSIDKEDTDADDRDAQETSEDNSFDAVFPPSDEAFSDSDEEADGYLSIREAGEEIPAYVHGYAWALDIVGSFQQTSSNDDEEIEELLAEARRAMRQQKHSVLAPLCIWT